MKLCANCTQPAAYSYYDTLYCDKHLPRFLRTKTGVYYAVVIIPAEDASELVSPPIVDEPVVEDVPETLVKKVSKASSSADKVAPEGK